MPASNRLPLRSVANGTYYRLGALLTASNYRLGALPKSAKAAESLGLSVPNRRVGILPTTLPNRETKNNRHSSSAAMVFHFFRGKRIATHAIQQEDIPMQKEGAHAASSYCARMQRAQVSAAEVLQVGAKCALALDGVGE